jgi:hypothetical protein
MTSKVGLVLAGLLLCFASGAVADHFDLTASGATTIIDGESAKLLPATGPGVISNLLYTNQPYVDYFGLGSQLSDVGEPLL